MAVGEREVQVSFGNGGWVRVDYSHFPGPLYLRFAPGDDDGQWHVRELYIDGEVRHVEAADLRRLPLSALETVVLADGGQELVRAKALIPGPDLSTLASHYATTWGDADNWVAVSMRAQLPDGKGLRVARPKEQPERVSRSEVPPLAPPTAGLTDEFLGHVAAAYVAAVQAGKSPAPELARQSGRPPRTIHRWVYLARKRGLLPSGGR